MKTLTLKEWTAIGFILVLFAVYSGIH